MTRRKLLRVFHAVALVCCGAGAIAFEVAGQSRESVTLFIIAATLAATVE